jgi:hypothetical protein
MKGETQKLPMQLKTVETYTDMTIHWNALEEQFLKALLPPILIQVIVFNCQPFNSGPCGHNSDTQTLWENFIYFN